jgi:hypothetical protein
MESFEVRFVNKDILNPWIMSPGCSEYIKYLENRRDILMRESFVANVTFDMFTYRNGELNAINNIIDNLKSMRKMEE